MARAFVHETDVRIEPRQMKQQRLTHTTTQHTHKDRTKGQPDEELRPAEMGGAGKRFVRRGNRQNKQGHSIHP